jgi:hypothetical protein
MVYFDVVHVDFVSLRDNYYYIRAHNHSEFINLYCLCMPFFNFFLPFFFICFLFNEGSDFVPLN